MDAKERFEDRTGKDPEIPAQGGQPAGSFDEVDIGKKPKVTVQGGPLPPPDPPTGIN